MECLATMTYDDHLRTKKYKNHNDAYIEGATKLSWKNYHWKFVWPSLDNILYKFPGPSREEITLTFLKKRKNDEWDENFETELNRLSRLYKDTPNPNSIYWIRVESSLKIFNNNNNFKIVEILTDEEFRKTYIDINYIEQKLHRIV